MEQRRGPIIFTGLYTAGVLLTLLALLMHERFGATEFKAWAPFFQAVLSAGAIFAAWWLQSLKRTADRRETVADTRRMIGSVSAQMENLAGELLKLNASGALHTQNAHFTASGLTQCEAMIRKLNFGHLHENGEVVAVLNYLLYAGQLITYLQSFPSTGGGITIIPIMRDLYVDMHDERTELIHVYDFPEVMERQPRVI